MLAPITILFDVRARGDRYWEWRGGIRNLEDNRTTYPQPGAAENQPLFSSCTKLWACYCGDE